MNNNSMLKVTLRKIADKGNGSLFPVGYQVEGELVDKAGVGIAIEDLPNQEAIFIKAPSKFFERPYQFSTDRIISVKGRVVETVGGEFELCI